MLFASVSAAVQALKAEWVWQNFSIAELACRCAGRFCNGAYWHDRAFLTRLQAVREEIGRPLLISSGHRCPQWNACVGGAPLSRHKTLAVDVLVRGHDRVSLRKAALKAGFNGIGLARSFLHLDRRRRGAVWYYPGSYDLWQT